MFSYRIFRTPKEVLVAICDQEILGKKFGDINFEVKASFYGGEACGEEELREILKDATIINAVGNRIIDFLRKENIVEEKGILNIGDVSHAQVVTV
jgi:hypothetical protein